MIRTATCLAAFAALAIPAAFAETKTYDAKAFHEIDASGAIDVIYERAPNRSISVEQAEGDFSDLYLEFDGETLVVSRNSVRDHKGWFGGVSINVRDGRKIVKVNGKRVPYYVVRVSGPDLDAARSSSSAKLVASGIESDEFDARASSSGDLVLSGTAGHARLHASSSGDLEAGAFQAASLVIHASSSGDVEAKVTGTGRVMIEASSSGEVELLSLADADFVVDASSSADVEMEGACATIEIEASSSADVDANELICREATVAASSSGDVSVHASDVIKAHASSSGDISVSGSPATRDVTKSSGGDIDFNS
ncbi:MAG: DUF2807 domain-containing protein [Hyphomonas sp.]